MSTKRAYYYHKKFNWKQLTNLFAYDVKFPDRLSKRQQILRLYKSCQRRLYEQEMLNWRANDIHSYSSKMRTLRNDFESLKYAENEEQINDILEKYEQFMEYSYTTTPWVHDNTAYEWRHGKGLHVFSKAEIENDLYGYYDQKLLNYYPDPLEWQFRDEYPTEDALVNQPQFGPNDWETVGDNDGVALAENNKSDKSPEDFTNEVNQLREKYKRVDMWKH